MAYNVYKGDELIATVDEKEYTVTDLEPNTEYSFSVSEVIGDKESEKATVTVKTKPIVVTGVELTPNNMNGTQGESGDRQLTAKVSPENATNKSVTYKVDEAEGLTVNASGVLAWTENTPAGTYTVTATTADGNKTDTSTLTINEPPEPEPDPEPEEPEE